MDLSLVNGEKPKVQQKSDYPIVAKKPMKVGGAKGIANKRFPERKHAEHTRYKCVETKAKEIRCQNHNEHFRVENLMCHVNEANLLEQHQKQNGWKAVGVDGVNKFAYEEDAQNRIQELVKRMKLFQYRPHPVKRVYIPKSNGKLRPLGIPAYEDKLVQGVMAELLSEVYEDIFLDCSYGFRPGRNCHDVVKEINKTVMSKKVNYVLEADIKGFFDNLDHEWLMKFLEYDIADKRFLRYIKRFLIAGVMEGTQLKDSDRGAPQGGLISPVCANVYLHYVLDLWLQKNIKPKLYGEAYYLRYADDFIILFQYENDAKAVMNLLKERLAQFSLELAEEKTRIMPIGRFSDSKDRFDFLGFTFFNTTNKNGKYRLGVVSSKKKLKQKRQAAKAWLKEHMHAPIAETAKALASVVRGHCNYYGVSGNSSSIKKFVRYLQNTFYRMINRRDQKGKMKTEVFWRIWKYYVPAPKICVNIWTW